MDRAGKRIHQWGPEGELFYKWDLAGNLTELTYPDGAKFGYTHLKTGQINEFKSWFAAWSTFVLIANYTYDDDGAETSEWIFGAGGNSRTWARNSARQVTDFDESMNTGTGWENYNADLTYDARGNLASETVNAGTTTAMTYDAAGQLRTQTGATPASYTYNARGTRTASSFNGASTTYTANPNGSIATATTGTSVVTYGYDHAGRRTSETTNVSGTTTATSTTTYNAAGKPATRTNTGALAFTETRAYDGLGQLVESDYTSGSTTANYTFTWDTTTAVSKPLLTKINGTTAVRMDYSNRLLDYQGGFYPTWYKLDARNSIIKPTANPAAADGPASYDPYGTTPATWFGPSYRSELQLINQIHLRNRDYGPTTGQFTTQDPLDGINGTTTLTNPYHYTNNNPYTVTDARGLRPDDDGDNESRCAISLETVCIDLPSAASRILDGFGTAASSPMGLTGLCVTSSVTLGAGQEALLKRLLDRYDIASPAAGSGEACLYDDGEALYLLSTFGMGWGVGLDVSIGISIAASNASSVAELAGAGRCRSLSFGPVSAAGCLSVGASGPTGKYTISSGLGASIAGDSATGFTAASLSTVTSYRVVRRHPNWNSENATWSEILLLLSGQMLSDAAKGVGEYISHGLPCDITNYLFSFEC